MFGRNSLSDVARRRREADRITAEVESQVAYRTRTATAVLTALSAELATLEAQGMTLSPTGVRERIGQAHQALVGSAG